MSKSPMTVRKPFAELRCLLHPDAVLVPRPGTRGRLCPQCRLPVCVRCERPRRDVSSSGVCGACTAAAPEIHAAREAARTHRRALETALADRDRARDIAVALQQDAEAAWRLVGAARWDLARLFEEHEHDPKVVAARDSLRRASRVLAGCGR